jgi:cytochrome P450
VPFGGGSRTCIGMRFGQQEIRTIARAILERFEPQLEPGYELVIRQMPTIGPKHGLPLILRERASLSPGARVAA